MPNNSINGCTNHNMEDDNPTIVGSLINSFNTGVEIDDGTKTNNTNNRGLMMMEHVKEEGTNPNETTTINTNNRILVQLSLILSQIFFGVGSVVAALGLPKCNPFVFAMIREISAAILLSCLAIGSTCQQQPQQQKDVSIWNYKVRFFCLGMAIFANQSCAIIGIKLAGPVASAVWQPSQPIITAAICILMRWEPINLLRILGITFAFLGCITMVLLSSNTTNTNTTTNHTHSPIMDNSGDTNHNNNTIFLHSQREETTTTAMMVLQKEILGNFFFFINCLGTSLYVILSKKPLQIFPSSLTVVATSYSVASICLIITCLGLSYYYHHHHEAEVPFCPECTEFWYIPHNAYFALFYFIMFNSVGAYALITWANQYASGTLVMGYTVLQPVTAAILTSLLVSLRFYSKCTNDNDNAKDQPVCLDPPGWNTFCGMLGVFTGLFLIIKTEPQTTNSPSAETEYSNIATSEEDEIIDHSEMNAELSTPTGKDGIGMI